MELESLFDSHLAGTSPEPYGIELSLAEGSTVTDVNGKEYIDFVAGIAVANVGHRHPEVVQAAKDQLDKYMHTMVYGEFTQDIQIKLADMLCSKLPSKLDSVYMVSTGTEANEAALKLAKRVMGRKKIVAFNGSYHGSTHGSLSVTGNEEKKYAFRPLLPDIHFIEFNEIDDLQVIDSSTAAVIVEPVQGDAGVRLPDVRYFKKLRERCTEVGALLIFDEIQVGMGRTGKMFAFEHLDISPDVLTLAKSLGGGLPIGVLISSKENLEMFTYNPALGHISTFGGNPVSCAAACTVMQVLENENLIDSAEEKGQLLEQKLIHKKIQGVRRIGLMLAVDLFDSQSVSKLIEGCKNDGLIIYRFLSHPDSFRISPPLNISLELLEKGCQILLKNLNKL